MLVSRRTISKRPQAVGVAMDGHAKAASSARCRPIGAGRRANHYALRMVRSIAGRNEVSVGDPAVAALNDALGVQVFEDVCDSAA